MCSAVAQSILPHWLLENGPRQLEQLFRAIIFNPSAPILITDNDRNHRDASAGAGRMLGVPREKLIGRQLIANGGDNRVARLRLGFAHLRMIPQLHLKY